MINSTIADNTINLSPIAGGLTIAEGTATLDNTIVALNTNTGDGSVRASDVVASTDSGIVSTSSAYNLIGSGGSGGLSNGVNGNQVGITNPGLGPLASNGGPTPTIGLLPGSPAIDRGSNALDDGLVTDQRAGFVRVYNNIVDIGAYEFQPAVIAVSVTWNTQTAALQTAADGLRLLPAGRTTDLPWLNIQKLQITFADPVTLTPADVKVSERSWHRLRTSESRWRWSRYTITLARPITRADRVTIRISGASLPSYTRRLDVLPGDFDDNGVVQKSDVTAIGNEWHRSAGTQPTIFGDIVGNGTVNPPTTLPRRNALVRDCLTGCGPPRASWFPWGTNTRTASLDLGQRLQFR